ncbi:MAG: NtaA/DmoA family FMN-dependent monooxygenase [Sphingomonadaceae bacterium]
MADWTGEQIHLVSFLINSPINHTVCWAQPGDNRLEALHSLELWQNLARTLERGMFDGIFFADTPGVFRPLSRQPRGCGQTWRLLPSLDPVVLLSGAGGGDDHLGLATTMSTGCYHPWTIVRQLGTIDYLSGGRVGWNIVTGHLRGEHRALGSPKYEHDQRWDDRADEYMEVCYKLWNSIGEGAILADRDAGIYADPAKVEFVEHNGEYFSCETVGPVPPSPQGRPVLFQAGSSGRGQQFALTHAEVVFSIQPNLAGMVKYMDEFRATAAAAGKPAPGVSFGIQPIVGGTEEEAKAKLNELVEKLPIDGCLARVSGTMGMDFSTFDIDQPLEEMNTSGSQGLLKAFSNIVGDKPLTMREVAIRWPRRGQPQIVGSPEQVADQMEQPGARPAVTVSMSRRR